MENVLYYESGHKMVVIDQIGKPLTQHCQSFHRDAVKRLEPHHMEHYHCENDKLNVFTKILA